MDYQKYGNLCQRVFSFIKNNCSNQVIKNNNASEADKKLLIDAINSAHLKEFIDTLPNGLDTIIGENGTRLSGGQRQRIGIARAIYNKPDVLIMDEATSALDNPTEKSIIEAIERMRGDRTIIMIAHRLTTVKNCDTIFVMKNGSVFEHGKYSELLKRSEYFRKMNLKNKK